MHHLFGSAPPPRRTRRTAATAGRAPRTPGCEHVSRHERPARPETATNTSAAGKVSRGPRTSSDVTSRMFIKAWTGLNCNRRRRRGRLYTYLGATKSGVYTAEAMYTAECSLRPWRRRGRLYIYLGTTGVVCTQLKQRIAQRGPALPLCAHSQHIHRRQVRLQSHD